MDTHQSNRGFAIANLIQVSRHIDLMVGVDRDQLDGFPPEARVGSGRRNGLMDLVFSILIH